MTLRLTVAEYAKLRAPLSRGPFGPIWPGGRAPVVLIVPEPPATVDRALVAAAASRARARHGRS